MHSKPGTAETLASQTATGDIAERGKLEANVNSDLTDFEGPAGTSPFYRSQVTSGHEGVASGYRDTRSNAKMQARAAGFGYEQPVAEGADEEIGAREASDQSKVERDALTSEAGMKMQAAGIRTGEMSQFNPDSSIKTSGDLENQRLNRRMQIFSSLAKLGMSGATMGLTAAGAGGYANN